MKYSVVSTFILLFFIIGAVMSDELGDSTIKALDIKKDALISAPAEQGKTEAIAIETEKGKTGIAAEENDEEIIGYSKRTFFQGSVFYPAQIFSRKYAVHGFRFNFFYSENYVVDGLDIAACGFSSSRYLNGLQLGIAGRAKETNGVQIVTFSSAVKKFNGVQFTVLDIPDKETQSFCGARFACIAIPSEIKEMDGLLVSGILSWCEEMNGVQFSYACIDGNVNGLQGAISFNQADELNGVQFGIVNYADEMAGAQIGVLNFAPNNWLPFSIGINFGF